MSTYTDLHNRVKESLTVDYNTRVTTQKISATNEENLFVGTFRGAFRSGSISQVSCIDCFMLSGLAKQQLMVDPLLSVGYNPQTQEPIVSALTAYIEAHGGNISVDEEILSTSVNPVQNKAIFGAFEYVRDYITNVLGTQITDLINEKFKTFEDLIEQYPPQDQEVGRSAIVYDLEGNAKFYTIEDEGGIKVWKEIPTKESMYVSKTTDVDKIPETAPLLFAASISPVDGAKLDQILSNFTELNDHVPTSKLVKTTAQQLSAMIVEGSEGAAEWIKDHFVAEEPSDVVVKTLLSAQSADFGRISVSYVSSSETADLNNLNVTGMLSTNSFAVSSVSANVLDVFDVSRFNDVSVNGSLQVAADSHFAGNISSTAWLSVAFDKIIDTAQYQLSDMLGSLNDSANVMAVCIRVNEIKTLADLSDVPSINYTNNVEDLFGAVEAISYPRRQDITDFQQAVSSLNDSLGELKLAQTGISLEARLSTMSNSIHSIADYVDSERKRVCQRVYSALSVLPAEPQVLDIITVSEALFGIRDALAELK